MKMIIEKISSESNSGGSTGANQYESETWRGVVNGKAFEVTTCSTGSPAWGGEDADSLDMDDCNEVMEAIEEAQ